MKKKSLKRRWPYFFGQRIQGSDSLGPGNMPELIKPESEWQRAESVIDAILRWADDGGQMLDIENGNRTIGSDPDDARKRSNKIEYQRKRKAFARNDSTSQ